MVYSGVQTKKHGNPPEPYTFASVFVSGGYIGASATVEV